MATCIQLAIETLTFQFFGRISINFFIYVQLLYIFLNMVSYLQVQKVICTLFSMFMPTSPSTYYYIPVAISFFLRRRLLDFPGLRDSER